MFKEGEEYDVLKDMQDAYQKSLSKSMHDRLFDLLPDHVFWDIKKIQEKPTTMLENRFNPMKPF